MSKHSDFLAQTRTGKILNSTMNGIESRGRGEDGESGALNIGSL